MRLRGNIRMMTTLAIFTALSIVLMLLIHFPIFPAAPYLEYEPMDIPILIAGFAYGPIAGLLVTVISSVIQGFTVAAAGSGWVGILMHFIATGTLVTTASLIYRRKHSLAGAVVGLLAGTVAMAAVMIPTNLIIQPWFYGVPVEAVKPLILPILIPFNLIKAGINSAVTFVIYKPLRRFIIKGTPRDLTAQR